ncbi:MAG: phosphoribosylanthranilate isomerase [Chloroflexi bacterium]|nr:phosphoribosylanthranilate isomerase [Chloroflexota bacterium]MCC6895560.1 phosphoribosylanthranilate isomerase [Anaerolineae bacterium]
MVKVKICGITRFEDALAAAEAGADLLGFNFYKKSPRYISPEDAATICDSLRQQVGSACPILVGVFVNEVVGVISAITRKAGLNCAQLHGDESEAMLKELYGIGFKAIRPMNMAQALDDVSYFKPQFPTDDRWPSLLLDAYHPNLYGGTGEQASTEVALAVKAQVPRLMLAGGLTPENVASRVQAIQPWGVDTASGVEVEGQAGVKDAAKVRAFIEAVRQS